MELALRRLVAGGLRLQLGLEARLLGLKPTWLQPKSCLRGRLRARKACRLRLLEASRARTRKASLLREEAAWLETGLELLLLLLGVEARLQRVLQPLTPLCHRCCWWTRRRGRGRGRRRRR